MQTQISHHLWCASLFLCLLVSVARTQSPVPTHSVDGAYLKEWLVLGPFISDDLGVDFLADVGGEAGIEPREGDSVATAEGATLTWKRYRTRGNFVDLSDALGDQENATAYAYCVLQSEVAGEAELLYSDDDFALWINGELFELNLRAGPNRCLVKISHGVGRWGFAIQAFPPNRAVISGLVTDETGEPIPHAEVRLDQDHVEVAKVQTGPWGSYLINVYPVGGRYDLSATEGLRGTWQLGLRLREGDRLERTLRLKEAIRISGTLLMPDETTPHVAVPVQVLKMSPGANPQSPMQDPPSEVVATTLSDKAGKYQFINLRPGRYQVRCQVLGGHVYYKSSSITLDLQVGSPPSSPKIVEGEILEIRSDTSFSNIDFRFAPFKKGTWRTYNTHDGLVDNNVFAVDRAPDGAMWFGTRTGASRYDGTGFVALNSQNGLTNTWINAIHASPDGTIWIGTEDGVSRYDGSAVDNFNKDELSNCTVLTIHSTPNGVIWLGTSRGIFRYDGTSSPDPIAASRESTDFVHLITADELAGKWVSAIYSDPDGLLWFGTIDGGAYCYDGKTPVNLTTADGLVNDFVRTIYRAPDGTLWFGTAGGISRYVPPRSPLTCGASRRGFDNLTTADGLVHNSVNAIHAEGDSVLWFGTDGGVSRYDGQTFVNFTTVDGLTDNHVWAIHPDREGGLWFGTERDGVSRYDGRTFFNFTTRDGLVDNDITACYIDPDGVIWFGTGYAYGYGSGVSRYDGREFVNFTTEDGLADNTVQAIERTPDGAMWFGTVGHGVSRYDGTKFETLNTADGLVNDYVGTIYCDPDGVLWFGTGYFGAGYGSGGVSRYDGKKFDDFTTTIELLHGFVGAIYRDPDGVMWFGILGIPGAVSGKMGGVIRYDGKEVDNFTSEDGLAGNFVFSILRDPDGILWFGTLGGGISRYDGMAFENFTTENGLANNYVQEGLYRAADGILWVGTGSGASGYDGIAWTSLDTRDGLAGDEVRTISQDSTGFLWFGTTTGVTRYRRSASRPDVRIDFVQIGDGPYIDGISRYDGKDLEAIIPSVKTETRVAIAYRATDFKTVPSKRQYRYRIREIDTDWRSPTRATTFEWTPKKSGIYTFEVQAIDRDLRYSELARVTLEVSPQYAEVAMVGGLIVLSVALVLAGGYGLRRRRERDQMRELRLDELESELQTAHDMQMSLMPTESPHLEGIDVAGQCLPATEVGGDFFQYFSRDDKLSFCMADVTGHAMKAAVPVMMFSGILESEIKHDYELGDLYASLNQILHRKLDRLTHVCFTMGELDVASRSFRLANAACPYPLHFRASTGKVEELEVGAYPLGVMTDTAYTALETALETGDCIVFCSDGISEAVNGQEEMFGFEQTAETIRAGCAEGLSAEALIDRLIGAVKDFAGDEPQGDDMTCVVLRVEV